MGSCIMMGQPWTEAWQLELGPEDRKVSEHADVKGNNLHFVTELYISLSLYIYIYINYSWDVRDSFFSGV